MKKTYTVAYGPNWWECQVAIDSEFVTPFTSKENPLTTIDSIKGMIGFWMGYEDRLAKNDGDDIKTFLQQLAREILIVVSDKNYCSLNSVITEFKDREGWTPMDGTWGIEILHVDPFSFDHDEFEVMEDPA